MSFCSDSSQAKANSTYVRNYYLGYVWNTKLILQTFYNTCVIIAGSSHGINLEDMDVAALLKEDTDDDTFEQKVCASDTFLTL